MILKLRLKKSDLSILNYWEYPLTHPLDVGIWMQAKGRAVFKLKCTRQFRTMRPVPVLKRRVVMAHINSSWIPKKLHLVCVRTSTTRRGPIPRYRNSELKLVKGGDLLYYSAICDIPQLSLVPREFSESWNCGWRENSDWMRILSSRWLLHFDSSKSCVPSHVVWDKVRESSKTWTFASLLCFGFFQDK